MPMKESATAMSVIVFHDRTEGQSKMSRKIVYEAIWMVWRLRWRTLTGKI